MLTTVKCQRSSSNTSLSFSTWFASRYRVKYVVLIGFAFSCVSVCASITLFMSNLTFSKGDSEYSLEKTKKVTVPPAKSDRYPQTSGGEDKDPTARDRRDEVREMMKHAWNNYVRYAWGENELKPLSRQGGGGIFGFQSLGATIVDALDTLYIMGLMDEFNRGRDWIAEKLRLEENESMSVFETNIRFVGGLLACFALTGDVVFREKAEYITEQLLPAFETRTGIPFPNVEIGMKDHYRPSDSFLAEFGTLSLELSYLSDITGNSIYRNKVNKILEFLDNKDKPGGLYRNQLNTETGEWVGEDSSMGARGDSFYEYLLKEWLRSGRENVQSKRMFQEAMSAVMTHMLRTSPGGLVYFSDIDRNYLTNSMGHLACFSGGLMALGAHTMGNATIATRYMEVARGITNTCHESYDRSPTKIGPEKFHFRHGVEARALARDDKYYILRPEVVESYFYMWRITKDPMYREWGWEAVQALQRHCRTPAGFSGLVNVYSKNPTKDDCQQTFFLAETLKYLYLLFSDDSLISLDEWVFNTEAHPLPIKGSNPFYRAVPKPHT